jgi:hypothetical protein
VHTLILLSEPSPSSSSSSRGSTIPDRDLTIILSKFWETGVRSAMGRPMAKTESHHFFLFFFFFFCAAQESSPWRTRVSFWKFVEKQEYIYG